MSSNEIPVTSYVGCPDGESPSVKRGEKEQTSDQVCQAVQSEKESMDEEMRAHNRPMVTSARGGLTLTCFLWTFLVDFVALSESLQVSASS